jgi:CHAD domain-containing protein
MMETDNIRLKEIKPVLAAYIRKSLVLLKRSEVPDDDAVHDIRVLMKKSRAILRLTARLLETDLQDRDLRSLKRAGQIMSEWRDTSVHRKTLKDLKKEFPDIFEKLEGDERIGCLLKKSEVISEPDQTIINDVEEIEDLLNKTGYRIRFHPMQKLDPHALLEQLESSYEAVRKIYLECRNKTRPERLHEFRKRSKDLLYQLVFFRPLNPPAVKSLEKRIERITVYLGRYNDIYQLVKSIGYNYDDESNPPALDELVVRMLEKQDEYLMKVWPSAFKCFCPGTKLVNHLGFKLLVI